MPEDYRLVVIGVPVNPNHHGVGNIIPGVPSNDGVRVILPPNAAPVAETATHVNSASFDVLISAVAGTGVGAIAGAALGVLIAAVYDATNSPTHTYSTSTLRERESEREHYFIFTTAVAASTVAGAVVGFGVGAASFVNRLCNRTTARANNLFHTIYGRGVENMPFTSITPTSSSSSCNSRA